MTTSRPGGLRTFEAKFSCIVCTCMYPAVGRTAASGYKPRTSFARAGDARSARKPPHTWAKFCNIGVFLANNTYGRPKGFVGARPLRWSYPCREESGPSFPRMAHGSHCCHHGVHPTDRLRRTEGWRRTAKDEFVH